MIPEDAMRCAAGAIDRSLSEAVSRALGAKVTLAIATEPAPMTALTFAEVTRVSALATQARREEWRLGRAALKAALRAVGEVDDTGPLEFPHARLSLTHSGSTAVAVVTPHGELAGIGVDLEMDRAPRLEAARFFLTDDEQQWLRAQKIDERRAHIVRLWTIKEAVFKADPENGSSVLRDYAVARPESTWGMATRNHGDRVLRFTYVSERLEGGTLSVAAHYAQSPFDGAPSTSRTSAGSRKG